MGDRSLVTSASDHPGMFLLEMVTFTAYPRPLLGCLGALTGGASGTCVTLPWPFRAFTCFCLLATPEAVSRCLVLERWQDYRSSTCSTASKRASRSMPAHFTVAGGGLALLALHALLCHLSCVVTGCGRSASAGAWARAITKIFIYMKKH